MSVDARITALTRDVLEPLKRDFVGRDEVVDLIALAVLAGEHVFLYGAPGTAKSALIRRFAESVRGRSFEAMLTRFTEPTELFGPIDLARLREGTVATVTRGMLPEAEFVFLDELFNANSAILNHLLTVLNERVYRRGAERHDLPLMSLFSASNQLPEDEALHALFDRFLVRCRVEGLGRDALPDLLASGWSLERAEVRPATVSADDLRALGRKIYDVDLRPATPLYVEAIGKVRDLGVALSDRRAVKIQKLIAASALLMGRDRARPSDLWVLRYVWDRPDQIGPLGSLVDGLLAQAEETTPDAKPHPRSRPVGAVDAEDLARQLEAAEAALGRSHPTLMDAARLREHVAALADRAAWLADPTARAYLLGKTDTLLERLG